jgi:hypothetical protein
MKRLIEVQLDDDAGTAIYAEVEEGDSGWTRAADADDLAQRAQRSFSTAIDTQVRPLAVKLREALADSRPDEVEFEFGLRLSGKLGAVLASAEAEGHIQVKMTWKSSQTPS